MVGSNVGSRADAVAAQRRLGAVGEPSQLILVFCSAQEHVLVIALEAHDLFRRARLGLDQKIHHVLASLAAVDVVAEEEEAMRPPSAMIQATPVQIDQLGVAAMDVANGISEEAGHSSVSPESLPILAY